MNNSLRVWVEAWQIQCCGDAFEVGSKVEWTLCEQSDRDWLTSVLGDEFAREITYSEEHHGGLPDERP